MAMTTATATAPNTWGIADAIATLQGAYGVVKDAFQEVDNAMPKKYTPGADLAAVDKELQSLTQFVALWVAYPEKLAPDKIQLNVGEDEGAYETEFKEQESAFQMDFNTNVHTLKQKATAWIQTITDDVDWDDVVTQASHLMAWPLETVVQPFVKTVRERQAREASLASSAPPASASAALPTLPSFERFVATVHAAGLLV
jgi:hypothetical protein